MFAARASDASGSGGYSGGQAMDVDVDVTCCVGDCQRPPWKGIRGKSCCPKCKDTNGKEHGLVCQQTHLVYGQAKEIKPMSSGTAATTARLVGDIPGKLLEQKLKADAGEQFAIEGSWKTGDNSWAFAGGTRYALHSKELKNPTEMFVLAGVEKAGAPSALDELVRGAQDLKETLEMSRVLQESPEESGEIIQELAGSLVAGIQQACDALRTEDAEQLLALQARVQVAVHEAKMKLKRGQNFGIPVWVSVHDTGLGYEVCDEAEDTLLDVLSFVASELCEGVQGLYLWGTGGGTSSLHIAFVFMLGGPASVPQEYRFSRPSTTSNAWTAASSFLKNMPAIETVKIPSSAKPSLTPNKRAKSSPPSPDRADRHNPLQRLIALSAEVVGVPFTVTQLRSDGPSGTRKVDACIEDVLVKFYNTRSSRYQTASISSIEAGFAVATSKARSPLPANLAGEGNFGTALTPMNRPSRGLLSPAFTR